jgi:hypothetical protein
MGGAALPLPADRGYVPQTAVLLRFLAAALIFGAVALACEPVLLARALPLFSGWLDLVDGTFHTLDLRVREINCELTIVRTAVPAVIHVLGGHVVAADPRSMLSASASAGIILQPLVLAAALLLGSCPCAFCWPFPSWVRCCCWTCPPCCTACSGTRKFPCWSPTGFRY